MERPDARTALLAGVSIAATALAGWRASLVGTGLLAVFCVLARIRPSRIVRRVVPLAGGLVILVAAAPFTLERALDLAVRGMVVSCTAALVALVVPWTAPVGLLQAVHAPRVAVAFCALLARQVVSLATEVTRAYRALLVRGSFDAHGGRVRSVRVLLTTLLPKVMSRADHLADALALRGFDGHLPEAPPWRPRLVEAPWYGLSLIAWAAALAEKVPWIRSLFASTT